jgi:hypothetical protein
MLARYKTKTTNISFLIEESYMSLQVVQKEKQRFRDPDPFWWFEEDPGTRKMPKQSFIGIGDEDTTEAPDDPDQDDRVYAFSR